MGEQDDGMKVKEDKKILESGGKCNENKDGMGEKWKIKRKKG